MYTHTASVTLANIELWQERFPCMEMMCRKVKTLCPLMEFEFSGLDPNAKFDVILSLQRLDSYRYGYLKSENVWQKNYNRKIAPISQSHFYKYPGGALTGSQLMAKPLNFKTVRVTNEKKLATSKCIFVLDPLHKYVPVVIIANSANPVDQKRFQFNAAQFFAVTGYQQSDMGPWKSKSSKYTTLRNGGIGGRAVRSKKPESQLGPQPTEVSHLVSPISPVAPDVSPVPDASSVLNPMFPNQYDEYIQYYEQINFQHPFFDQPQYTYSEAFWTSSEYYQSNFAEQNSYFSYQPHFDYSQSSIYPDHQLYNSYFDYSPLSNVTSPNFSYSPPSYDFPFMSYPENLSPPDSV